MNDMFSARFFSRSSIMVCFFILIFNLVSFFYLTPDDQSKINYYTIKPSMGISLISALGTCLMTILIIFHKHKLVTAVGIVTLLALIYLKFFILS